MQCPTLSSNIFHDENEALGYAIENNLIDNTKLCINKHLMEINVDNYSKYGIIWKCPLCSVKKSILNGSIFSDSKIGISKMLKIIYCWSHEYSCKHTMMECSVSDKTVTSVFSLLRNSCFQLVYDKEKEPIGGPGYTIEVDETLMSRRKYNRGRMLGDMWIFGGICRETGSFFAYLVPNRKSETLLEIIQSNILPGTTIISDLWKGYSILDSLPFPKPYEHLTVNHSINFVDPITNAHTQRIERLWRGLKEIKSRYNGIQRKDIDLHLAEFIWRKSYVKSSDPFIEALRLLSNTKFI